MSERSEKLAPVISAKHFAKMMELKPTNARKHTYAGQLLMGGHRPGVRQTG